MNKSLKIALINGLIVGILMVTSVYLLTFFNLGLTYWVLISTILIVLFGVYKAHVDFKLKNNDLLSIKTALLINIVIVLIGVFIQQLNMVIYINYIDTGWTDMVIDLRRNSMLESGMSETDIQQNVENFKNSSTPIRMLTRGVLVPSAYLFIISGLVIFFTKSSKVTHKKK